MHIGIAHAQITAYNVKYEQEKAKNLRLWRDISHPSLLMLIILLNRISVTQYGTPLILIILNFQRIF